MSTFQDTTTGLMYNLPVTLTLEEALSTYPSLPRTLSETLKSRPTGANHVWVGGEWVVDAAAASAAELQVATEQIKLALSKTDDVYIRCGKAGVTFPTEWQTYVVSLRAALTSALRGTVVATPTQPAFPAGT